jgi:propionyl-CoA carboxylase alpha chain
MTAAAAYVHTVFTERAARTSGRLAPPPAPGGTHEFVVILDKQTFPVEIRLEAEGGAELWMPSLGSEHVRLKTDWRPGDPLFEAELDGRGFALSIADRTEGYVLRHRGLSATVLVCTPRAAELHARLPEKEPVDTAKLVTSPMPGLVVSIAVETGQEVKAGEALITVEAMKMENVLRAEVDGVIKQIACEPGASVAADELLIEFE